MLSYSVADLLRSAPGTSERHVFAVPTLSIAEEVEVVEPVRGEVRLIHSGRSVIVQGHVDTVLAEPCSRCLRPARALVSVDFEEEALPSVDVDSGAPLSDVDDPGVLRVDEHHHIDLEPAVRDAISLAEPIAPLCRADCPGLCKVCGIDLADAVAHSHPDDEIDPRLASLASLAGIRERLQ